MTDTTPINYIVLTEVVLVQERFEQVYISGVGQDAVFEKKSLGWFVWLKGSYEAIHLGAEPPGWKEGDKVKVTFERVT